MQPGKNLRIVTKINGLGDVFYFPQYRKFLFWKYYITSIGPDCYVPVYFESFLKCQEFLESQRKLELIKKLVTV